MLLFRSEGHLERWLAQQGLDRGGTMTVEQGWRLGRDWYADRLSADWRRPSPDEAQELVESIGLTGPFWRLA